MIYKQYKRFEKTVSSLKFAVVIITLLAIGSVYGTFMESYHGTEYAGRAVYKSWWFMAIQFFMFLSILVSTIVRLPPKKRLYGFYTIHSGLIIIFIGSLVTYINGVDGTIELLPNKPTNKIQLNEDVLKIQFVKEKKAFSYKLPYVATETDLNSTFKTVKLKKYLPFSKTKVTWTKSAPNEGSSASYLLYNENFSENLILSLNPTSDYKSLEKLGLLNVHYMPEHLYDCFLMESKSGYLFWNLEDNSCFSAEQKNIKIKSTDNKTKFVEFDVNGKKQRFFPDFSPIALKDDLTKDETVPYRAFSRSLFKNKPHLFIFGKKLTFYQKRSSKWVGREFTTTHPIKLPWMNFKIVLNKYAVDEMPVQLPYAERPIQINNELIEGNVRALEIEFAGVNYWVRSDAPLSITNSKETINFIITYKSINLPYELTLSNFVMKTDPGTTKAASYESFVSLLDGRNTLGAQEHHVFMNNPLKYDDFTFYQSSYFNIDETTYGSVFSVNLDPGRPIKYFGSILLVFGSIWHYFIRRKKKKVIV